MARDGYAYAVLADGARPYRHRAGVRALLGAAEETGVRVSFTAAVRGRSFRYVREYQGDTAVPSGWDDVLAEVSGGEGRLPGRRMRQLASEPGAFDERVLEGRASEVRVLPGRALEGRRPEARVLEGPVTESRAHESRAHEGRVHEGRVHEGQASEATVLDEQASEARVLEGRAAEARASHVASHGVRPRGPVSRVSDAAAVEVPDGAGSRAAADGYARAVLVDGAQPYLHRAGARALLGVAEDTGVRTSFTSAGQARALRYVREHEDSSTAPSGWDDVLAQTEAVRTTEAVPREPEPTATVTAGSTTADSVTAGTPVIVDMVVPGGRTRAATSHRAQEPTGSRPAMAPAPATRSATQIPVSEGKLAKGTPGSEPTNAVRNASARPLHNEPPTVSQPTPEHMPVLIPELALEPNPTPAPVPKLAPTLTSAPTPSPDLRPSPTPHHAPHTTPRSTTRPAPAASAHSPSVALPTPRPIAHPESINTPPEPDPADPFAPSPATPTSPRRHITPPYRRTSPPPTAAPTPPQQSAEPTPTSTTPQNPTPARTPALPQVVVVRAPAESPGEAAFWERRHLGRLLNGVVR